MGYLLIGGVIGIICALIAHSKGRSAVGWFFVGFFLGIIGLVIALLASNLEDARAKEMAMENEQRRLREQLRQERLKNEQFRKHTQLRLDSHDGALGLDTRHTPAMLPGERDMLEDELRPDDEDQLYIPDQPA